MTDPRPTLQQALEDMRQAQAEVLDGTDALAVLDRGMARLEAALGAQAQPPATPC